ncbi:MAG TPA: DALR anticodon-binding domain-containing protein, partial [Burkholderiaceae bacterium]|nr:DALR anticodon-binding domain-containing protein [Burkholderiaceae bacterium]
EKNLAEATARASQASQSLFEQGKYSDALCALAPLKGPVDEFFDTVMVNAPDDALRANRLALLAQLHTLMNRVADLSVLAAG